MIPSPTRSELYVYWQYFPTDFCCLLGRPEDNSSFGKELITREIILALRLDDHYMLAELEKMVWEGVEKLCH